jgi:hypothetical protein
MSVKINDLQVDIKSVCEFWAPMGKEETMNDERGKNECKLGAPMEKN